MENNYPPFDTSKVKKEYADRINRIFKENNYPSFESNEVKEEYADRINRIFKKNNFDWDVFPVKFIPQIFVKPKDSFEWGKFPNVIRTGVDTKKGVVQLVIWCLPSMRTSAYKKILEDKGYDYRWSSALSNLSWLIKPLNNLESLVGELKDIYPILLQR